MATPGFMLSVDFNVLVHEQVIPLFESRPSILLYWNVVLDENVFYALEAQP